MSDENDPNTPNSSLSKKARLAHWITGGTNRGPSTMSSFVRMTRDRNDVKKATRAWSVAGQRGLDEHQDQWGRPGLMGALDQARGTAARPRGAALIRWFREGGGGGGGVGAERPEVGGTDAVGQPEMQQRGRQGRRQASPAEDDIYGAGDDTIGPRVEGSNTGDGDTAAGTTTGDGAGQPQIGEGGNGHG